MADATLHPLTLRFDSPRREVAFAEDYFEKSLHLVRLAILLGCVQYALFGFLDGAMVPESAGVIRAIRVVVCGLILLLLALTFTRHFNVRTMQPLTSLVPLVGGIGVGVMAWVAQDVNAYYDYYAGLMVVLVYIHALLRLRFVYATAVSVAIIGTYELVTLFLVPTPLSALLNNTFFLASANVSGMVASYALEFYARKLFWKTRVLDQQRRRLESEGLRKSKELEASRQFQLDLLPTSLPDLPHVEIAVYMKTATEVGGDYYDFAVAADGTLTFAIGDATGHGAEAGAMVTATKVLFACLGHGDHVDEVLRRATRPMKQVGRSRLFMALALGRLRGHTLELAGAGMPPALVHRAALGTLEEIPLKGMPLGSFVDYDYHRVEVSLEPGDTVVLMSDGFPELFAPSGEMLGYETVPYLVTEGIDGSADAVIKHLTAVAERWSGSRPQGDDVTFLVLRMRPEASANSPVGRDQRQERGALA